MRLEPKIIGQVELIHSALTERSELYKCAIYIELDELNVATPRRGETGLYRQMIGAMKL
jgi:hypothetical protein